MNEPQDDTYQIPGIEAFAGILGPPPDAKTLMEYINEIDREPMVRSMYLTRSAINGDSTSLDDKGDAERGEKVRSGT